jgi:cellulose synthase/poly-beta-1,6-N-acetylglucosamine synthase-like glycosyltransferase
VIKYHYVIRFPIFIRLFYLLATVAWCIAIYGFTRLVENPWFWLTCLIPIVLTACNRIFNYFTIFLFYRRFNIPRHNKRRQDFFEEQAGNLPTIDIFLPNVGEDIAVLRNTYEGVAALEYPREINVYALDDGGRGEVEALASEFGFHYIHRANAGEMKKAGNLLNAFNISDGDQIIVFDADVRPAPDFILEALPYTGPEVGIVQTPQYFPMTRNVDERSRIEWQAGYMQQDFYRLQQSTRGYFDAAICVGTSAIYSRRALEESGGFAQVDRSEDVFTGLKVNCGGFKVKYIPLILAVGYNPPSIEGYFRQHNRWCSGSVKLATSEMLWSNKFSRIKRAMYLSGSINYLAVAIGPVLSIHILAILLFMPESIRVENFIYFVPNIIIALLMPLTKRYKPRPSLKAPTGGSVQKYTYLISYWMLHTGQNMEWTATAEGGHNKTDTYRGLIKLVIGFLVLHILALLYFIDHSVSGAQYWLLAYPLPIYALYSIAVHYQMIKAASREYRANEMEYKFEVTSVEKLNEHYYGKPYASVGSELPLQFKPHVVSSTIPSPHEYGTAVGQ